MADDVLDPEPVEYLLVRIADRLRRRFEHALRPVGLTPRQFSALAVLARAPRTTAADLARAVLITPQSTGALIDQLEAAGLIRERARRGRGIAAPVELTDAGRRQLAEASRVVCGLDTATRRTLGTAHDPLRTALAAWEDALATEEPTHEEAAAPRTGRRHGEGRTPPDGARPT